MISFCNNKHQSLAQTVVLKVPGDDDFSSVKYTPVPSGFDTPKLSFTGLCTGQEKVFLLCPGEPSAIAILAGKDLSCLSTQFLPEIFDAHSVIYHEGKLYIASTGTDEIIAYDVMDNLLLSPEIVWKASDTHKDTHHVNSIINIEGDFYISAFGPKNGELHSSAKNGYIHNISRDERIKGNIYHPHTLAARNETIYFCESSSGNFCSIEETLFHLNGYARGIAWLDDNTIAVATSIGRKKSKSTGKVLNPADPGAPIGSCAVSIYRLDPKACLTTIDFSDFSSEIYDILNLDHHYDLSKLGIKAFLQERNGFNQKVSRLQAMLKSNQHMIATLKDDPANQK